MVPPEIINSVDTSQLNKVGLAAWVMAAWVQALCGQETLGGEAVLQGFEQMCCGRATFRGFEQLYSSDLVPAGSIAWNISHATPQDTPKQCLVLPAVGL